jgi:hypothetical protein
MFGRDVVDLMFGRDVADSNCLAELSRIQTVWLEFLQPVRLFPPQKLGNCLRLLNLLKN